MTYARLGAKNEWLPLSPLSTSARRRYRRQRQKQAIRASAAAAVAAEEATCDGEQAAYQARLPTPLSVSGDAAGSPYPFQTMKPPPLDTPTRPLDTLTRQALFAWSPWIGSSGSLGPPHGLPWIKDQRAMGGLNRRSRRVDCVFV